ncbi:carotenoid biosynthesis protein [Gordonia oryzae]|uniref:Carotenoid biosynthesis protein n=1 Tax=Gordonia oryzae TaxID=2487349 RepID=A0A3N4GVD9_9ACTN|nr:carotenoid biosynthesis protein [Gordonia oryzae]RPA64868.1 carotenoid biosynthesis protein [Gordonia oryzae]
MTAGEVADRAEAASGRQPPPLRVAAWILLAISVGVQIAFPLTGGGNVVLTTIVVVAMSAAMLCHGAATHGVRGLLCLLAVGGGGGLLAEAVGVHTGIPFGDYTYTDELGGKILGVPVVVPLAWIMMSWPAFLVAQRLAGRKLWAVPLLGAYALTAWDVFLDPQMVDAGYWRWSSPHPGLPGVEGIPLTNFAGWLLVSASMMAVLSAAIGRREPTPTADPRSAELLPLVAYLWVYGSSVIAHLLFFGRPPVALVGGLVMGVVAIPLAISMFREVRR